MLLFIIFTTNILGAFNDPFEFEGDYGDEMNPTRNKVFELVVPREALVKHLSDAEITESLMQADATQETIDEHRYKLITEAILKDSKHGPTLGELVSEDLLQDLSKQAGGLNNFSTQELDSIKKFINTYKEQRVFRFLNNLPKGLLNLDKALPKKASANGQDFSMPILSSITNLTGENSYELRVNLLKEVITEKNIDEASPEEKVKKRLFNFDENRLKELLGIHANLYDLEAFCSPAGQAFIYYLYHSLDLYLISQDTELIGQINKVKEVFSKTLGNPETRAAFYKKQFIESNAGVVFTQECNEQTKMALIENGQYHPVDKQNPKDGCFIFLQSDLWNEDFTLITINEYKDFNTGKFNLILATTKTGEKFLLASAHGSSSNSADGRLQLSLIMKKFNSLKKEPSFNDMQLIIGMDANTKTEKDVSKLHKHLDYLGLTATKTGFTTVKKRMATSQSPKACKLCIDEEDYLITLKADDGSKYSFTNAKTGFNSQIPSATRMLPDVANPSDHYPVSANFQPL